MLLLLAGATIYEKVCGTDAVHNVVYDSWPFFLLWALVTVAAVVYIVSAKLYRRWRVLLLHIALVVILLGAGATWLWAQRGTLRLSPGQASSEFVTALGDEVRLPFEIRLLQFEVKNYTGTQMPSDFVSTLQATDADGHIAKGQASMNHVFSHDGYRFFQSGYDPETGGTVLSVQHDPVGIWLTYAGYALLLISVLLIQTHKHGHYRQLLRKGGLTAAFLLCCTFGAMAQEPTLPKQAAEKLGDIYIMHGDRMCPFETFARDFTIKLCGAPTFHGLTATQVASGWIFYIADWKDVPMIRIKNQAVRRLLGISGKWASFQDFVSAENKYKLEPQLMAIMRGEQVPNAKAIREADDQYELASMMATGQLLKIFPLQYRCKLTWHSPVDDDIPTDIPTDKMLFMGKGLNLLNEMAVAEQWDEAEQFLVKFRQYQVKEAGQALPSQLRFKTEKFYNAINHSKPAGMASAAIGIILFILTARGIRCARIAAAVLGVLTLYLAAVNAMRWIVGGHLPMSNGPETMEFLSLLAVIVTWIVAHRYQAAWSYGFLVAGMALMVSGFGDSNPQLTPLMPVLQSPLLSLHVAIIMLAYALLAFLMLNGIMAISRHGDTQRVKQLHITGQLILMPAVFLLAIGIFIGAVWANVSWGTYWSWDPKETWALITLIIYAAPLHAQSLPAFHRPMVFHIYTVGAFLSVIFTYFGVNYLLSGMHSYA